MFKNRTVQMKFIRDEDLALGMKTIPHKMDDKSKYELTAQAIVLGRHLTLGVMAVIATYVACDAARQIAVNALSK